MSLKGFHIFFILLSILLLAGFGYWAVREYTGTSSAQTLVLGIVSLLGAAALSAYLGWFIRKAKSLPQ